MCNLAGKSETAPWIFSLFYKIFFMYFLRYEIIETHARAFSMALFFSIAGVSEDSADLVMAKIV